MLNLNFTPFPQLQSERLLLRQLHMNDEEFILNIRSNEQVNKFIQRPPTISLTDARAFITRISNALSNNQSILWLIEPKNNGKPAGTICLWNIVKEKDKAETGYELLPEYHGQGIMSEALRLVLDYGFNVMKLKKIEAFTHAENERSLGMIKKAGFRRDLETESETDMTKEPEKAVIYSLSGNKWN
jgi:ribosomal-protein-alanine N-acetyltransferase